MDNNDPLTPQAIFDSEPPRYRKVVKPISKRIAKQRLRGQAQVIRARITALRQELAKLLSRPLDTETVTFERLHPGDPDYSTTSIRGWGHYQGDLRWLNPKDT